MRRAFWFVVVPGVAMFVSCLGPTLIHVDVTTNACGSLGTVDIYLSADDAGFTAASASTKGCASTDEVGTLTIVPSGDLGEGLQLAVVGSLGGNCDSPATTDPKCIVARRALSFIPHTPLDLSIYLDSACAGHACPLTQTCVVVKGAPTCVDESCNVDGGMTCSGGGDAGSEGGVNDAGGPKCPPSAPNAGAPSFVWSFEPQPDNLLHEDTDQVPAQPLAGGAFATANPQCGSYFVNKSSGQPLVTNDSRLATRSFELAFAYKTTVDTLLVSYEPTKVSLGGYQISIVNGALSVTMCGSNCTVVGADGQDTSNGAWHTVALKAVAPDGGAMAVELYRDGVLFATSSNVNYFPEIGVLALGPASIVDQLEYYVLP